MTDKSEAPGGRARGGQLSAGGAVLQIQDTMPEPARQAPLDTAKAYAAADLCVLSVLLDGSKRPNPVRWKPYQTRKPTAGELARWFTRGEGFGLVCGAISGNLEVLEFDDHALLAPWVERVEAEAPGLLDRLPLDNHDHFYYRCAEIDGNAELAMRKDEATGEIKTLIETRGEGGFIIVPPTAARYHPAGRGYAMVRGDLRAIPTITPDERTTLLYWATEFNEYNPVVRETAHATGAGGDNRPGIRWADTQTWADILEPHGWEAKYQSGDKIYWRRPGKDTPGCSATTNYGGYDTFHVFSSNALPFRAKKGYTKFTAYVMLNHNSDWTAATRAVVALGFGDTQAAQGSAPQAEGARGMATGPIRATDAGNARRLVARHGADLAYCAALGGWYVWDGQRWASDDTGEVWRRAKDTVNAMFAEAALLPRSTEEEVDKSKRAIAFAYASDSARGLGAMVKLAESEQSIAVRAAVFDADPWLLNCENGTLDLRTGQLRGHARGDLITKLASVAYDPGATHPTLTRYLADATGGDKAFETSLQRAAGYSLTGDVGEECFFLMLGPGATGKTTLVEAMLAMLGDYGIAASFETFLDKGKYAQGGATPELARLRGARLVIAGEAPKDRRLNEAMVKKLTGEKVLTARELYAKEVTFGIEFKLWLAANECPELDDKDSGLWRRLKCLPFVRVVPEERRDPAVKKALAGDARPALLAWAVAGCLAWQRDGLKLAPVVRAATVQLRASFDPLAEFFAECCEFGPDKETPAQALSEAYATWAASMGVDTLKRGEWGKRLRLAGCKSDRPTDAATGKKATYWRGIAIRANEGQDTPRTPETPKEPNSVKPPRESEARGFTKNGDLGVSGVQTATGARGGLGPDGVWRNEDDDAEVRRQAAML